MITGSIRARSATVQRLQRAHHLETSYIKTVNMKQVKKRRKRQTNFKTPNQRVCNASENSRSLPSPGPGWEGEDQCVVGEVGMDVPPPSEHRAEG